MKLTNENGLHVLLNASQSLRTNSKAFPTFLSEEECSKVNDFHQTLRNYQPTPLESLHHLAKELGVSNILVKDESYRFGLNAFKVLGASYAIAKFMCQQLGKEINEVTFAELQSAEMRESIGQITFTTATDGNHGRAVAWAAQQLGQKAVVFLPKGSAKQRVEAIRGTGAETYVTDLNYDNTVSLVKETAKQNGWQVVQDTAWDGYTQIPEWIMQGYTTMATEAVLQLESMKMKRPTHLFLQAGVGSMAAAVLGYFLNKWKGEHPTTVIVEPHNAACIYHSVLAGDEKPHPVSGDLATIMAGLSCGEPNPIAWETLRDFSDIYMSCSDYLAARGMRILANPLGNDQKIVSGESGAIGIGVLSVLMQDEKYQEIRNKLKLNNESVVLFFSTEGDTDLLSYRQIVWDGKYPM